MGNGIMGKGNDNTLLTISIIVLIASAIGFFIVLGLNKNIQLAPAVGEEGTAKVEIIQNARIDTTFDVIDFLSGFINPGTGPLTLDSNNTNGPITNWLDTGSNPITVSDRGFVIENVGNINLVFGVQLETALDTWLPPGPSTTSVTLDYKLSNCDTTLPSALTDAVCTYTTNQVSLVEDTDSSCTFASGTTARTYETIPLAPAIDPTCSIFTFTDTQDEVRLDLRLVLPEDILPTTGSATNNVIMDIVAV